MLATVSALDGAKIAGAIILILVVVVGVHELGHFTIGKLAGIRIDQFSIGFGPKLVARQRGETLYALRAFPLGGFVKMPGMTDLDAAADAGERNFNRASIPKRTAVILAGVVANFILAGVLYSVDAMPDQPSQIPVGSALYGKVPDGAQLLRIGSTSIDTSSGDRVQRDVRAALSADQGRPTTVAYRAVDGRTGTAAGVRPYLELFDLNLGDPLYQSLRLLAKSADSSNPLSGAAVIDTIDGAPVGSGDPATLLRPPPGQKAVTVTGHIASQPRLTFRGVLAGVTTGNGDLGRIEVNWRLGITLGHGGLALPAAVAQGFTAVPRNIGDIFNGLYTVFSTPNSGGISNFQGPVGIAASTAQTTQGGWLDLANWMAFISLNLGIVNVLPIPFLDGGRFALLVVEAVRRRRLDPRRELALVVAGAALVATFVLIVTINDIKGF